MQDDAAFALILVIQYASIYSVNSVHIRSWLKTLNIYIRSLIYCTSNHDSEDDIMSRLVCYCLCNTQYAHTVTFPSAPVLFIFASTIATRRWQDEACIHGILIPVPLPIFENSSMTWSVIFPDSRNLCTSSAFSMITLQFRPCARGMCLPEFNTLLLYVTFQSKGLKGTALRPWDCHQVLGPQSSSLSPLSSLLLQMLFSNTKSCPGYALALVWLLKP